MSAVYKLTVAHYTAYGAVIYSILITRFPLDATHFNLMFWYSEKCLLINSSFFGLEMSDTHRRTWHTIEINSVWFQLDSLVQVWSYHVPSTVNVRSIMWPIAMDITKSNVSTMWCIVPIVNWISRAHVSCYGLPTIKQVNERNFLQFFNV